MNYKTPLLTSFFLISLIADCLGSEPLYLRLISADDSIREPAYLELDKLTTSGKKEVVLSIVRNSSKLESKIGVREVDSASIDVFKHLKSEAAPILADSFKDKDPNVRNFASWCLGNLGPVSIPSILKALKDKNPRVRYYGISAITPLTTVDETDENIVEIIPALTDLLNDPVISVRDNACRTFGAIGSFGASAVPDLTKLIKDKNKKISLHALHTLGMIGPGAKESAREIAVMLQSKDKNIRREAAYALSEFGVASKVVLSELLQALLDSETDVRLGVINSIGNIGPEAKEAVTTLVNFLVDPDTGIRWNSAIALTNIDPKESEPAIPVFVEMLKNVVMKSTAINGLKKIGTPKALKAVGL